MLALAAGVTATTDGPGRIVDIRFGQHADYDRLVIQLEKPVAVTRPPLRDLQDFVMELQAKPLLQSQVLETDLKRMGTVSIESTDRGARISFESRPRRVRVFQLENPVRIVVDAADPSPEPFDVPVGTAPVVELSEVLEPEPVIPPDTANVTDSRGNEISTATPEISEAPLVDSAETLDTAQAITPDVPVEAVPETDIPIEPIEEAAAPSVPIEPIAIEPLAEPDFSQPRTSPPSTVWPDEMPATGAGPHWLPTLRFSMAIAVMLSLSLFGVIALVWFRLRQPRTQAATASGGHGFSAITPSVPETITRSEIIGSSDRVDILEKRIDEEVRARMQLEERLFQTQEELKVLRDRVHRVSRRGEGGA